MASLTVWTYLLYCLWCEESNSLACCHFKISRELGGICQDGDSNQQKPMGDVTVAPSTIYYPFCGQHWDLILPNHPSHYSKQTSLKLNRIKPVRCIFFLFPSLTEAFTRRRATWPWHEIHIKAEEFCETSQTVHLSRPHPQHSTGWNLRLICYQTQLVFPADVHRPGVMKPLFCTSCVKICQDCSLMLLTFGVGLLPYAWQTLVPKGLSLPVRTVMQHQVYFWNNWKTDLHRAFCPTGTSMWGLISQFECRNQGRNWPSYEWSLSMRLPPPSTIFPWRFSPKTRGLNRMKAV